MVLSAGRHSRLDGLTVGSTGDVGQVRLSLLLLPAVVSDEKAK